MKIVTWNCNGALRKKTQHLEDFKADILVIQECEDPAKSTKEYQDWAGDYLWTGESKNKGIGIFVKNENTIEPLNWNDAYHLKVNGRRNISQSWKTNDLQTFLPCRINGKYTLLGIWTKKNKSPNFGYIGQLWKYLQIHKNDLAGDNVFLCGDLNSNVFWDEKDRWWNHSDVVAELEEINIHSLYHNYFNEAQGSETRKTLFLYRNPEKSYHIDYFFGSKKLIKDSMIEVLDIDPWLQYSDHVPLFITIEDIE
jgi:exonuclease III